MEILFVCRANVGRSQMAAGLFNKYSKTHHADSVGFQVDGYYGQTGQILKDFAGFKSHADNVMKVM